MKFITTNVLNEGTPDNICLVRCEADRNLRVVQVEPTDTQEAVSEWLSSEGLRYESAKEFNIIAFYKKTEPKQPKPPKPSTSQSAQQSTPQQQQPAGSTQQQPAGSTQQQPPPNSEQSPGAAPTDVNQII